MLLQVDGVQVKAIPFGESSQILILFTRELGKLAVMAKGVKKSPRSSKGLMQSFSHNTYQLSRKRGMGTLTSVDNIETFQELTADLDRVGYGYECLQLIQAVIQDDQAVPALFDACLATLRQLSSEPKEQLPSIMLDFKKSLLRQEGLLPDGTDITYTIDSLIERHINPRAVIYKP